MDDISAISTNPRFALEGLKGGTVKSKNDKIKTPEMHLEAKLQKKSTDGIPCWAITGEECIQAAVNAIKASIAKSDAWSIPRAPELQ